MKIIYVKPNNSSFIRGDEELLSKHFEVSTLLLEQAKGNRVYFKNMLKMCWVLLSKGLSGKFIFACWFADYHSALMTFFARITGNKSVIFIGGQETVCYPELGKGVYRNKFRGWFVGYSLRNATQVIANHQSLIYHENKYYNAENPHIDGVKHYVKGFKTPVDVVYNGVDPTKFVRDPQILKQQNLVLTVGTMSHLGDFQNKGFDMFIQVAARRPQWQFVLIGLYKSYLDWVEENYAVSKIPNLKIIPSFCPQDILSENYNKAQVFVQCSITEGMPNTLSEAMLLECIPVGSNINGIPDAIGKTGVVVQHRNVEEVEAAIEKALQMNTSADARQRVIDLFSFHKREKQLYEIFKKILELK
jgi:glycosyltransferase involved in cell wall biosynthesis